MGTRELIETLGDSRHSVSWLLGVIKGRVEKGKIPAAKTVAFLMLAEDAAKQELESPDHDERMGG